MNIDFNKDIVIINEKCEKVLPLIPDNYVDLVITSPPYNVDLGNNKFNTNKYDTYNDNKDHKEYIEWLKNIFSTIYKKVKKGGRVIINIGDGKNGMIPTHSDIIQFMTNEIGYLFYTTILWNKRNTANRTAWGSFKSPSCPSLPRPFEFILIFAKETRKLQEKGESDLNNSEFIDWSLGLWDFAPETDMIKKYNHPAMFPLQLPWRCAKLFSWKNSVIMDPFNGAGTTGVAAKMLGRKYIGIDMSEEYCKVTKKRLSKVIEEEQQDIFLEKPKKYHHPEDKIFIQKGVENNDIFKNK